MPDEIRGKDDVARAPERSEHGDRSLDQTRNDERVAHQTGDDRSISESNSDELPEHRDPTGRDDTDARERQSRR